MKGLNLYLSGKDRKKLLDILHDYIYMLSVEYENTGNEEVEKILDQAEKDLQPIFCKLYKGLEGEKIYNTNRQ